MADIDFSKVQVTKTIPVKSPADLNADTIREVATTALTTNRSFIALPAPGAGLVTAHVKQMARQQNAIIRLLLGQLEGTD